MGLAGTLIVLAVLAVVGSIAHNAEAPAAIRARAEAASGAEDWATAAALWSRVNRTSLARGASHLAEARAWLALGKAAAAEAALRRASAVDPSDPVPWHLRLEILRLEDRRVEAQGLAWSAYSAVPADARRGVLRDVTLALLADLPDDLAERTLDRWVASDPADVDARVARLIRSGAGSGSGPRMSSEARIAELSDLLGRHPEHVAARDALIDALADAGEIEAGRRLLEAWPESARDDPRYWRLRGRWALDYDRDPARAAEAFGRFVALVPQDWKGRYQLARALQAAGRASEARAASEAVTRLRETLEPDRLGTRLSSDLERPGDPKALADLAELCRRAGLDRLAEAWMKESLAPGSPSPAADHAAETEMGPIRLPHSGTPRLR